MSDKIGRNDLCICGSGKKYKKCCLDNKIQIKDCFGDQGGSILHGETPVDCLRCDSETFEKCHKVTIATSLQGINLELSLITGNGLEAGWLKCFNELAEKEE